MGSVAPTGAHIIAQALRDLGVTVIFGIVGIPVVEIAEQSINLGIRFIGFRNEQAAGYAASAYGYLTGRPGVCLVVGGPGVLHAIAGVGNSSANAFPLLLLAGSSETHLVTKGAFQELDAVSLLKPHTKLATRPPNLESIPHIIRNAYRHAYYGRPGTGFVDFPADLIQGSTEDFNPIQVLKALPAAPAVSSEQPRLQRIAQIIKDAKSPLVVIGKGAATARAEDVIRKFINKTALPFLPSPMGKGVIPDSHPANASSARSTALNLADVVLLLGARLNWIFHFGEPPKWNESARFIQVDICPDEIGRNQSDASLGVIGDIGVVVSQLLPYFADWRYDFESSLFTEQLTAAKLSNEVKATSAAASRPPGPLSFARAFKIIKDNLHSLSPPSRGGIVYVSEGANTMDVSRSVFPVEHPRLRLDAGTYATMGVGLGYAIAAHVAYNSLTAEESSGSKGGKKIVAFEGDSAFGFSAMEVETMARYGMDVLIFVMNNGGVYHGDSDSADEWLQKQAKSLQVGSGGGALRSTSLGWEVRYEKIAEICGGKGYFVRTEEELERATREGFKAKVPVVVNVIVESGKGGKLVSGATSFYALLSKTKKFGWQASAKKQSKQTAQSKL